MSLVGRLRLLEAVHWAAAVGLAVVLGLSLPRCEDVCALGVLLLGVGGPLLWLGREALVLRSERQKRLREDSDA